ncbi:MAG: hypothetical protein EWV82_08075 [Microcystis aeruginosa Ma_AC_P_19900807_S299]|jgi:hypothetical protein|uniref:Uncharacterized protein n=1 Tax=Microcystis aeruginosa Ma_SC_T_19800800_S464 TaxID=2486257 RepID=A0A552E360_MICAE|nr:MAG: hypothetical protein EWV82_08075 [Microcystis aeruginosa Ma_AC_P_19900807_S299]TRU28937.1 MAG: hypothetical protein EWV81_03760 [Microcystis aeruginosa Ma_SC_T_19800800_S464]
MDKDQRNDLAKKMGGLLINFALTSATQKLEDLKTASVCNHCEKTRTNYMTRCCHQPICHACFLSNRQDKDSGYSRFGASRSSYWGETTFRCPFCEKEMSKTHLDPDSMASFYQTLDQENLSFVVKIDNPKEGGNWS